MSLEERVASVLTSGTVCRIAFSLGSITVNQGQLRSVAKAIRTGDIEIKIGSAGSQFAAAYTSWRSRRWKSGEKSLIGKITLGNQNSASNFLGQSAILHESIHALMDVAKCACTVLEDETIAYLTEAIFWKMNARSPAGGTHEVAIYNAAFAVVDTHLMISKPGAKLTWADCAELQEALKAVY